MFDSGKINLINLKSGSIKKMSYLGIHIYMVWSFLNRVFKYQDCKKCPYYIKVTSTTLSLREYFLNCQQFYSIGLQTA